MKEEKIQKLLSSGKITPEQADALAVHTPKPIQGEVIRVQSYHGGEIKLFDHNSADAHYEQRMDIEEGIRHIVGLPCYGFIAAVDSLIDAVGFGLSEIAEDITFIGTRIIFRAKDGVARGKIK